MPFDGPREPEYTEGEKTLLILAEKLDNAPEHLYNQETVGDIHCGTAGCALGWATHYGIRLRPISRELIHHPHGGDLFVAMFSREIQAKIYARELLGIRYPGKRTPKQAATVIRAAVDYMVAYRMEKADAV